MRRAHIGVVVLGDVPVHLATYVKRNMNRSIPMTTIGKITINNETIDIAAIEANARKMRAEVLAEYGRNLRTWVRSLFVGLSTRTTRTAH
jgi:hypothetical protein